MNEAAEKAVVKGVAFMHSLQVRIREGLQTAAPSLTGVNGKLFGGAIRSIASDEKPTDWDIVVSDFDPSVDFKALLGIKKEKRDSSEDVSIVNGSSDNGESFDVWHVSQSCIPVSLDYLHESTLFTINGVTFDLVTSEIKCVDTWSNDLQSKHLRLGSRARENVETRLRLPDGRERLIKRFERFMKWAAVIDESVLQLYEEIKRRGFERMP